MITWAPLHGALLAALVALLAALDRMPPLAEPRWERPILLDRRVRDRLRARTREGRERARRISDWLLWTLCIAPYVGAFGAALTPGASTAGALLIAGQANALCAAANRVAATFIARARPWVGECLTDPDYVPDCASPERFKGFFSGHACLTFGGAAMLLVESRAFGVIPAWVPTLAATLATLVALLRVVSDRHYLSDTIVGAAVGWGIGLLLPGLLHGLG